MVSLNPPTRRPRPARGRALRNLPWTWYLTGAVILIVAVKTWPVLILVALAVAAMAVILNAIGPDRLAGLFTRIDRRGVRCPAFLRGAARPLTLFEGMSPSHFEHAIAQLSAESPDVRSASVHGGANDRGRDVLVRLDDGRRILIQCKRYTGTNKVTSQDVQKLNGTWRDIHRCDLAVIVTTSGFTRSAIDTNLLLPTPIRLIDGTGLTAWATGGPAPWN